MATRYQGQAGHRVSDQSRAASMIDLATTGSRLIPKQLKDSLALLADHFKSKGVSLGVALGFGALGLLMLFVVLVSLIVAMIGGFASETSLWQAALWVALAFFIIAIIFFAITGWQVSAAMPLVPTEVIRGVKHDLGYLAQGNDFDPVEFDRLEAEKAEQKRIEKERQKELAKQAKKENKAAVKRGEAPQGLPDTKPTTDEIRHRMELRRQHLGDIRSGLEEKGDVRAQLATFTDHALGRITPEQRDEDLGPISAYSTAAKAGEKVNEAGEFVKERWVPLAVLGGSLTAMAVFARGLVKK